MPYGKRFPQTTGLAIGIKNGTLLVDWGWSIGERNNATTNDKRTNATR